MNPLSGPAAYFRNHPRAHLLALSGALLAGAYFGWKAAHSAGLRKAGWFALLGLQVVQAVGIARVGGWTRREVDDEESEAEPGRYVVLPGR